MMDLRLQEAGTPEVVHLNNEVAKITNKTKKNGFASLRIRPASQFFAVPPPPIEWLVRGVVERKNVVMLAGAPKTAKSWMALEMALSVCTGTNMFDDPLLQGSTHRNSVLCFMLEDSEHSVYSRVKSLALSKGIRDVAGLDMYFRFGSGIDIADTSKTHQLASDIAQNLPDLALITFDPFRNMHSADENDSAQIMQIMENLRHIRDVTGASVLVVHHTRKPTASDKMNPGFTVRGSGAIYGAVDGLITMMNVDTLGDEPDVFKNNVFVRVKAGREATPFSAELRIYDGEDGRAERACWQTGGLI
jgi:RecA-family ATPase